MKAKASKAAKPKQQKTASSPQKSARKKSATAAKLGKKGQQRALRAGAPEWLLRLYIAGMTITAATALENLKEICDEHLGGMYQIEVIDLLNQPQLASGDQIIAVPTLVRRLPT